MTLRVAQGDSLTSWATNSFSMALSLWSSWMVSSLLHESATLQSADGYVDSLRRDWLSHHRRATVLAMNEWFPRSPNRAQHRLQMMTKHVVAIVLCYVPGRKLTKTWTRNCKHRYFITLYKGERCKVYEVWSWRVVFWDGRRCLSAELAKSQVTVVWTSNNDLTWIWGHKFYGFSTNVHTNSREHYCAVLQLALVKQIKVNRPN